MELIEQKQLPGRVHFLLGISVIFFYPGGHRAPHFRFPQGQFGFPVAPLDGRLGGEHAPMGGEIEFSVIGVGRAVLLLHVLKELHRAFQAHPGHSLQVFFPKGVFDMIPGGPAAAVAIAEGQQERVQMILLHPLFPGFANLLGLGAVGVAGGQEGVDAAAVHALPGEIVVWEAVAVVIGPEDFLGHQVFDAALFQQLGQGGGIAEAVRQPQHQRIHAQLVLVETLAVDQLPGQGFAGGHIGVRLHPHGPFRDPLPAPDGLPDAVIQFGIILPADHIGRRLALQVFVLRIPFDQAQLSREGAGGFPVGFLRGPEPGQIQMSVADGVEVRDDGAILRRKRRPQGFPGRFVAFDPRFPVLLKIHNQGGFLQRFDDLGRPQAFLRRLIAQFAQGFHIQIKLIGVLVPDAKGDASEGSPLPFDCMILIQPRQHRPGGAGAHRAFREIVPGVSLQHDFISRSGDSVFCQKIIHQIVMGNFHPSRPVGAEGNPVHKHRGFPACF